jgi:hypothetical protein
MHLLGLLALAALGFFWWQSSHRYGDGDGPFDRLPAGTPPKPAGARDEAATDGTRYRVFYWTPTIDNRQLHVAELKGKPAWISFWFDRATGKRTLVASLASAGELNDLRKDWGV